MIAFDLLAARDADATDPAATPAVIRRAHSLGLIVLGCGSHGEAVRLLFPLTIPDPLLDEGMALLADALHLPACPRAPRAALPLPFLDATRCARTFHRS